MARLCGRQHGRDVSLVPISTLAQAPYPPPSVVQLSVGGIRLTSSTQQHQHHYYPQASQLSSTVRSVNSPALLYLLHTSARNLVQAQVIISKTAQPQGTYMPSMTQVAWSIADCYF